MKPSQTFKSTLTFASVLFFLSACAPDAIEERGSWMQIDKAVLRNNVKTLEGNSAIKGMVATYTVGQKLDGDSIKILEKVRIDYEGLNLPLDIGPGDILTGYETVGEKGPFIGKVDQILNPGPGVADVIMKTPTLEEIFSDLDLTVNHDPSADYANDNSRNGGSNSSASGTSSASQVGNQRNGSQTAASQNGSVASDSTLNGDTCGPDKVPAKQYPQKPLNTDGEILNVGDCDAYDCLIDLSGSKKWDTGDNDAGCSLEIAGEFQVQAVLRPQLKLKHELKLLKGTAVLKATGGLEGGLRAFGEGRAVGQCHVDLASKIFKNKKIGVVEGQFSVVIPPIPVPFVFFWKVYLEPIADMNANLNLDLGNYSAEIGAKGFVSANLGVRNFSERVTETDAGFSPFAQVNINRSGTFNLGANADIGVKAVAEIYLYGLVGVGAYGKVYAHAEANYNIDTQACMKSLDASIELKAGVGVEGGIRGTPLTFDLPLLDETLWSAPYAKSYPLGSAICTGNGSEPQQCGANVCTGITGDTICEGETYRAPCLTANGQEGTQYCVCQGSCGLNCIGECIPL